jgi:outer membrane receptor protein involved in Fe transport
MTSKNNKERLIASTLLAGVASLGVPFAVGAAVFATATDALAQDYTSGTLRGVVADENGEPVAGVQVTIRSEAQGFERSTTTNANGEFTVPVIPIGNYTVSLSAPGYPSTESRGVSVVPSNPSVYAFEMTSGAGDEIIVTAARQQLSFSENTTGLQINVQELTDRVPVGQNVQALALLAPSAVQGGAANKNVTFGQQTSVGGSSIAENAFFVNGLNITNFDNYLGASLVPFEFYRTVEVMTGGYQAEFGRATGGVINAVTKSGTNDWVFRLSGSYDNPDWAEDAPRTTNDANEYDENTRQNATLEVGGPIWRDRLFVYGMAQYRDNEAEFANMVTSSFNIDRSDDPFYAAKIDFNLTDDHRFEATWFDTSRTTTRSIFNYTPAVGSGGTIGAAVPGLQFIEGGESFVFRYTGAFTDFFTLSGAYGVNSDSDNTIPQNTIDSLVNDFRPGQGQQRVSQGQATAVSDPIARERIFYRVDADFFFDLAGAHHVRAGWDRENLALDHVTYVTGNGNYRIRVGGPGDLRGQAAGQNYYERRIFDSGGSFEQTNEAYYLQDTWEVLDNLTLNLGVRLDTFDLSSANGSEIVAFDEEIGPRFGFSWDPANDGTNRVFGSFGRYYLPLAANTAYRMGATELFFSEYFQVGNNGTPGNPTDDYLANGLPVGGFGMQITQLNSPGFTAALCPTAIGAGSGLGATSPGADACAVSGDGTTKDPSALVAQNLQSTYEDEFILGWEHRFDNDWTVGLTGMWRTLGRTAEDSAIDGAVLQYCTDHAIPNCSSVWTGFHQYVVINPGDDVTVILDATGHPLDDQVVTFSAEDLGYPSAQRDYYALTFDFERPWDGQWMLQGSYTLALSEGNYEGQVKSDVGQDDVGITQDFDQPALVDGSYGLLPNHRAHQFKVFGAYALTESLTVGANATVLSPRHFGCLGLHPPDGDPLTPVLNAVYGAASWFCSPTGAAATGVSTPRGSQLESDWTTQLDLSFRYALPEAVPGDLTLRLDIFNVFNSDAVTSVEEVGSDGAGGRLTLVPALGGGDAYGFPASYQAPRFVRVGFAWEF